ncbi:MAG: hypothetical protein ACE5OO_01550 [Candidatus Bathyarchaeia archaeon]
MSTGAPSESESWRMASMAMLAASAVVFLSGILVTRFFEPVFEFCIFHLPALISVIIYLRKRSGSRGFGHAP